MIQATLIVRGAAELAAMAPAERVRAPSGPMPGPARGQALADLGLVPQGAIAAKGERIVWVGPESELGHAVESGPETIVLDAAGGTILPGFVDPHTHIPFAGERADEFGMRIRGHSYQEIAAAGGGILASVRAFRGASRQQLAWMGRRSLDQMLTLGTTTVEAKTGYGLNTTDELRALEVLRDLDRSHPVDVIPTFLGAHAVPPEYRDEAGRYIDLVIDEMLPAVAAQGIARFCDVFCEPGYFTREQSKTILTEAARRGLSLKLHADEFADSGGAVLAAELGAVSADHLMAIGEAGIAALASSTTIPVLLPGTSFFLGMSRFAPGRRLAERGLPLAIATDFNPGSSMVASMPLITSLACLGLGLTPEEALVAATRNAAAATALVDRGVLVPGALADLQVLALPSSIHVPYHIGPSHVTAVVKRGVPVVESGGLTHESPSADV
jgi:imidazolonepropionase